MIGILRSLIWKEWHELKWKVAALVAIATGVPVLVVVQEGLDAAPMLLGYYFLPFGAMFLAMSVAAGEPSRGTLAFCTLCP